MKFFQHLVSGCNKIFQVTGKASLMKLLIMYYHCKASVYEIGYCEFKNGFQYSSSSIKRYVSVSWSITKCSLSSRIIDSTGISFQDENRESVGSQAEAYAIADAVNLVEFSTSYDRKRQLY